MKQSFQEKPKMTLNPASSSDRVIIHVDADCFAVQVWTKDDPSIQNKPIIVTNGQIITSVNYPAREYGISSHDSKDEAFGKCPDMIEKIVPDRWGKLDVSTVRLINYSFIDCICKYRKEQDTEMPIDFCGKEEFYVDVTKLVQKRMNNNNLAPLSTIPVLSKTILESTESILLKTVGSGCFSNNFKMKDQQLIMGGIIAVEIVQKLKLETGIQFSAGVATNKLLATLACELNKPAAVTLLTDEGLSRLASQIKIENIRQLGGKAGQELKNEFNVDTMEKLKMLPQDILQNRFGTKKGSVIHRLAWGIDNAEVTETVMKPTIKCSINLLGRGGTRVLKDLEGLKIVINDLAEEMVECLQEEKIRNKRRPCQISIALTRPITPSSNNNITSYAGSFHCSGDLTKKEIVLESLELLQKIWDKSSMPLFQELTQARIIAKNFIPFSEEIFN